MRVLHLATSSEGGAGIAAKRIVSAQNENGLEAKLISRDNQSKSSQNRLSVVFGKIVTFSTKFVTNKKYGFVSPYSVSTINLQEIQSFKPDIINIHNWYNFLSLSDILNLSIDYPIVFTLHDSRLATGGCHVTLGCRSFETECKKCPAVKSSFIVNLSKLHSDRVFLKMGPYAVVSPSNWLVNELRESTAIRASEYSCVIHNPIKRTDYLAREHQSTETTKVLFVSASLDSEFKGLRMLMNALEIYSRAYPDSKLQVKLVGDTTQNYNWNHLNVDVINAGVIDQESLQILMSNSDLLVVPSQSDNFPSVISEAQLAGLLVVGTKVGGIPEMIEDGITGVVSENNASDFADAIYRAIKLIDKDGVVSAARIKATERIDESEIAKQYSQVYKRMLQI